jgi:hypothetical protein
VVGMAYAGKLDRTVSINFQLTTQQPIDPAVVHQVINFSPGNGGTDIFLPEQRNH